MSVLSKAIDRLVPICLYSLRVKKLFSLGRVMHHVVHVSMCSAWYEKMSRSL